MSAASTSSPPPVGEWEPWMDEAAREAQEYIKQCAEDQEAMRKWRRKMLRTHRACSWCYGTGWDGDVDDYGHQVGFRCATCEGSGWVPKVVMNTDACKPVGEGADAPNVEFGAETIREPQWRVASK